MILMRNYMTAQRQGLKSITSHLQVHVKGHAGHKGNEEADKLAKQGAKRYKSQEWGLSQMPFLRLILVIISKSVPSV